VAAVDFVPLVHGNRGLFLCGNSSRKPWSIDLVTRECSRFCADPNSDKRNEDFENRFDDCWPISSEKGFRTAGIPPARDFCVISSQCTSDAIVGIPQESESCEAGGVIANPARLKFSNERRLLQKSHEGPARSTSGLLRVNRPVIIGIGSLEALFNDRKKFILVHSSVCRDPRRRNPSH
jgi:hypothetical protein